jgi:hypothetical protein
VAWGRFDLGSGEVGGGGVGVGVSGKGHTNGIVELAVRGATLVSCGLDDTLRVATLADAQYTGEVSRTGGGRAGVVLGGWGDALEAC